MQPHKPYSPDPFIDPKELRDTNAKHDAELRRMGIDVENPGRVGSAWNAQRLIVKGKLTDKQVEDYANKGFYGEDFKAARRELWKKRSDNFREVGGRMIFNPK
jgi:hypothetical protein